ncbi:hypothetical protein NIES4073_72370 [Kalymmatonema gypsitolerans NIES-4073]|nr:hypothetical protein NIES4073_72370 [Scytonema sp. NIES-4073]
MIFFNQRTEYDNKNSFIKPCGFEMIFTVELGVRVLRVHSITSFNKLEKTLNIAMVE